MSRPAESGRRLERRWPGRPADARSADRADFQRRAVDADDLDFAAGGKIRPFGEPRSITEGPDLPTGSEVEVVGVNGTTLKVRAIG